MASLRSQLSARSLDDVPAQMRLGSPSDFSDGKVWKYAKRGCLHMHTNHAVVFRVAFKPRLGEGEEPLALSFGFLQPVQLDSAGQPTHWDKVPDVGWLLVTSGVLRWHYCLDGVPGLVSKRRLRSPIDKSGHLKPPEGPRSLDRNQAQLLHRAPMDPMAYGGLASMPGMEFVGLRDPSWDDSLAQIFCLSWDAEALKYLTPPES